MESKNPIMSTSQVDYNPSAEFEFLRWRKKEEEEILNQNKIASTWNLWSNEEEKEINNCTISICFFCH